MKRLVVVLAGLLLLTGCASKSQFLVDDVADPAVSDFTVKSINVLDTRDGVSGKPLDIPTFAWPGKQDMTVPPLTPEHENLIKTVISNYISDGGPEVDVMVYLEKGYKEFRATWFGEVEHVEIELKIDLHDNMHTPYLYSLSGSVFYEVRSMDASNEFIEKLYQKAIRSCIKKTMSNIPSLNEQLRQREMPEPVETRKI